ncbi:hypothetical protein KG091_07845 [Carnobacteriaceae bacterium zg-ZUI78]|nr:hypothetical protein [Carnobacteriaceae bacterium zg-ZUI78]
MDNLLFYDIEVFKEDALIVLKDRDKQTKAIFHNDFEGLINWVKGYTLVGYNNYFYDDYILTYMLDGKSIRHIKELNDDIISGKRGHKIHSDIKSLDCFQQIDVSMPSLKKIEANFGKNIFESSISFDINRALTKNEVEETIRYCSYDVDTTIDVFNLREKSYFEPKLNIIEMLPKDKQSKALRWNTTTISANLLLDKPLPQWSDIRLGDYQEDGEYELLNIVPKEVKNYWRTKLKGKVTHEEFGCILEFGFGGLHGVSKRQDKIFHNVKLLDVASLYPNIIMKLNALGVATDIYREIVEKRLSVKHTDKVLSNALKLVINSCYGLLNNQYSILYNPNAAKSVCFYGQICLYDLCQRLSHTCQLININTDGVAFTTSSDDYKVVWSEWEKDYGFTLEEDSFDIFIQKDVNNYVGVKNGKIKCKGGDVGRYHEDSYFKNNSQRIIDLAVVNKLVYDKDVLETIQEYLNEPRVFQIILQAGSTYSGTYDQYNVKYNKVNRVFPIKKDGVLLHKRKIDGSTARFPDAPEYMLVWNDELSKLKDFAKKIDVNFYYKLINKVLERWE